MDANMRAKQKRVQEQAAVAERWYGHGKRGNNPRQELNLKLRPKVDLRKRKIGVVLEGKW